MGEAKEREVVLRHHVVEALRLETASGGLKVHWDGNAQATALGQMPFFIEFLTVTGLFDQWVADCPLDYKSPNGSSRRDILGTWLLSILSGHWRYAHVSTIRADGVNPALLEQVAKGKLKSREKIGFHVARILSRNQGHRYFDWRVTENGEFEYFDHPIHLQREKKIEGKYLIQTEEKNIDAVEAVRQYKELSEVERGFRSLKDVLEMRPIYHHRESRVKAHIFVAALAFLLERVLERKLKEAGTNLSVMEAWQALRTIGVVEFDVGGSSKVGVTSGSARAREVLRALGVSKAELPQRSGGGKSAA
jgi:hypothetical protein